MRERYQRENDEKLSKSGVLEPRSCPECGELFTPNKHNYGTQKYCSMQCTRRVAGRTYIRRDPERHKRQKLANRWGGNHKAALERDGRKCQICGSDKKLNVHHMDGTGENENPNHQLDNLATLCHTCHIGVHRIGWKVVDGEFRVFGLGLDWMKIDKVKVIHIGEEVS